MIRETTILAGLNSGHFAKPLMIAALILAAAVMLPVSALAQGATTKDAPAAAQPSPTPTNDEVIQLRKQVQQLTAEVARLKSELLKFERYKTVDYTRELMLKEEQRVHDLQNELVDNAAKETALQKRLDEIEFEARPDRIERSLAGVGSTKPEADRDAISKRLGNEKQRIQAQIETLRAARTRIPSLIANAEESIARLKQRLIQIQRSRLAGGPNTKRRPGDVEP